MRGAWLLLGGFGEAWTEWLADWSGERRCSVLFNERTDCGRVGITREACLALNCCWRPAPGGRHGIPWCFQSRGLEPAYSIRKIYREPEDANWDTFFELIHKDWSQDPAAAKELTGTIQRQADTFHLKIVGDGHAQVPVALYKDTPGYSMPLIEWLRDESECQLSIDIKSSPFQFTITRKDTAEVLFSTEARDEDDPFDSIIYKQPFVEIGTQLLKDHHIYGLGERTSRFKRRPRRMAMNARDTPAIEEQNSYGTHPFYMEMRNGRAHGVLMLNSHPMEVELTSDALVYRMIGGVIDMYFFAGPTPDLVVEQYTRIVGRPPLVEAKFFGLHQCRYGYETLKHWQQVVDQFDKHQLPLDGVWFDIE
jgi:hypothetical protein